MKLKLTPAILIEAYSRGYFPMPEPGTDEVLWYRPDPRAIIPLDQFHVSKSLQRRMNKKDFTVTFNQAFPEVMKRCAEHPETWINDEFISIYTQLHKLGYAHSVEVWQENALVGGTYGVVLGSAFFAESMFHSMRDASKIALFYLVTLLNEKKFTLLECQFLTEHLASLGAIEIPDKDYIELLKQALA